VTTVELEVTATRKRWFAFPDPVNETAVRVTAAGVALLALVAVLSRRPEPLVLIAYGFCARVLAGPTFSPLAQLAVRVVAPRLTAQPRLVAGPPKRFAQGLGAAASVTAVVVYYAAGWHAAAFGLALLMVVLATLESAFRICVGCIIHAWLARRGVVRSAECVDCGDISLRLGALR
jgi:type IV secretory pathway TrbD component